MEKAKRRYRLPFDAGVSPRRPRLRANFGRLLFVIDRLCGGVIVIGAIFIGGMIAYRAFSVSFWLLLPATMFVVTGALLAPSLWRRPELGMRLHGPNWPKKRRFAAHPNDFTLEKQQGGRGPKCRGEGE